MAIPLTPGISTSGMTKSKKAALGSRSSPSPKTDISASGKYYLSMEDIDMRQGWPSSQIAILMAHPLSRIKTNKKGNI